jgi:hypothetical protein
MKKKRFIEITEWQKKTFGQANALSNVYHLLDEVHSLMSSLIIPISTEAEIREELTYCFILLYGAASSHGMSYEDISVCIDNKMKVNYGRTWGKPDANGVVRHKKESNMIKVRVGDKFGITTSTIPHRDFKIPVWFTNSDTFEFIEASKVEFI